MTSSNTSITTSTAISALLHGMVFVALWSFVDQVTSTGNALEIELVHSIADDDDRQSQQQQTQASVEPEVMLADRDRRAAVEQQNIAVVTASVAADKVLSAQDDMSKRAQSDPELAVLPVPVPVSVQQDAQMFQSTDASQLKQSLVELLHRRISANKDYPYLARRQRREGVAKVGFVLQPSGEIQHTYLVRSSDTASLDRAALSAVQGIEPIEHAAEYIEQAEAFTIDVVFSLI